MLKSLQCFALLMLFLGSTSLVLAQSQSEVQSVKVNNLSDDQIRQIIRQMNEQGLSPAEAAELARARGATQQQIDQMMTRIREIQLSGGNGQSATSNGNKNTTVPSDANFSYELESSQKTQVNASDKNKRIFGYQLFNQDKLSFEPSVNIPVPSDYVVGMGDEISINVWGDSQQSYQLTVDGTGSINIPDLGAVKVAGQNFATVRNMLIQRLSAIYSGMSGSTPNTFADVSINNLRSIKVNVVGEALSPGTYTLPATASAFNALYLSGGPNENGSFRSIRVMRDNKLVGEIDAYDYLLNNNARANIALRDQDVLIIPTYTKRVQAKGAFKRNGIFELKENENISSFLAYTGGFADSAFQERVLITRYADGGYKLEDVKKDQFGTFQLKNGDQIQAEKVINRFENRVSIEGAVYRPGTYALAEGMTLSSLFQTAGGLIPNYFASRGLIIRLDKQLFPNTIPFNVEEVLSGQSDITLQREDQIIIRDIYSIGEQKDVRIYGEVMKAGEFKFYRNMTLKDLIFLAGGMREAASESYIEVARRNNYAEAADINNKLVSLFSFSVDRNLKLNAADENFTLQPFDQVYVRKAPSYEAQQTVSILGEVKYPGQYSISNKNERISDLVERAGGLTPYAYTDGARMKRMVDDDQKSQLELAQSMKFEADSTLDLLQNQSFKTLELQLHEIMENQGNDNNYTLRAGDEIFIPMKSGEIWVNGEVMNPSGLTFNDRNSVKNYINAAGGFSDKAKKGKVYLVYANGSSAGTKHFLFRKYPKAERGCQIIVPEKPERSRMDTGTWLAIASTFSSITVAIVAVLK